MPAVSRGRWWYLAVRPDGKHQLGKRDTIKDVRPGTWAERTVFWYRHQDDGHRPSNAAMSLWQDSSIDARQRRGAT